MKKAGYVNMVSTKVTSQSEPIIGKNMVQNNAGGFSFEVTDETKLDRFLIMGSIAPTYYVGAKKLTISAINFITEYVKKNPKYTIDRIVEISAEGRAPKNDHALYALAICAASEQVEIRKMAMAVLPKIARTGTHLFQFVSYVDALRGWGSTLCKGINKWYSEKKVDSLAYQVLKYKNREGWTHRDIFRKTHITCAFDDERSALYRYIVRGEFSSDSEKLKLVEIDSNIQKMSKSQIIDSILTYNIPREMIPTEYLKDPDIWMAMLNVGMPITAMLRNIRNMYKYGILNMGSKGESIVVNTLIDKERIIFGRVHPLQVYQAKVFGNENGNMSKKMVEAFDVAFENSFKTVVPSNKRVMCAFDISGSMWGNKVYGFEGLDAATASAIMGMATVKSEPNVITMAFTDEFRNIDISHFSNFTAVSSHFRDLARYMGSTDCSLPMVYAKEKNLDIDAFIVYTDNETWAGRIHPVQALKQYRQKSGIASKLIVVGMCTNNFTIADPSDSGMLDICGFDSSAPSIMADFIR